MTPLDFLMLLESFRLENPCSLDGGFRTQTRNALMKGAKNSYHLRALAADLVFDSDAELYKGAERALDIFGGVELDLTNKHLHVDGREGAKWHVVKRIINGKSGYYDLGVFLTQAEQSGIVSRNV